MYSITTTLHSVHHLTTSFLYQPAHPIPLCYALSPLIDPYSIPAKFLLFSLFPSFARVSTNMKRESRALPGGPPAWWIHGLRNEIFKIT